MNIILASGSPRRRELLAQAGFDFKVEVSNADENVEKESPTEMVEELAETQLHQILTALDSGDYGQIVRAKGIVPNGEGKWLHFDYVPEEHEVRFGPADYTGRLCVIGANLDEHKLHELFGL